MAARRKRAPSLEEFIKLVMVVWRHRDSHPDAWEALFGWAVQVERWVTTPHLQFTKEDAEWLRRLTAGFGKESA